MASERVTPGERGRFLVLDGVDGCGKSTQARRLVESLGAEGGAPPLHLREPGSTRAGEALRSLLLDAETPLDAGSETLLFVAARRCMLSELVGPALAEGRDVVCERFHPSTFAYQAVAGELDPGRVLALMQTWAGDPAPDLVILLDLSVSEARARARARGSSDRFEARGVDFQERVAEGFARYARENEHVVTVSADGAVDEVSQRILAEVRRV